MRQERVYKFLRLPMKLNSRAELAGPRRASANLSPAPSRPAARSPFRYSFFSFLFLFSFLSPSLARLRGDASPET